MITHSRFRWTILLLLALTPPGCRAEASAPKQEHFIFLARGMSAETRRTVAGEIYALVGRHSFPGESIHFLAAPDDRVIASLTTPSGAPNRRLRHREVQPALRALAKYFGQSSPDPDDELALQLQLPEAPARVSRLRRTQLTPHVVLCGSPLYHDPRRLNWTMSRGHAPLDDSMTSLNSPWSEGMERFPEGTQLAVYTPAEFGQDAIHRSEIVRWVRYAYGQRGAAVLAVTPDAATAFSADKVLFPHPVTPRNNGAGMRLVVVTSAVLPTDMAPSTVGPVGPAPVPPLVFLPDEPVIAEPPVLERLKGKLKNVALLRDLSQSMLQDSNSLPSPVANAAVIADMQAKARTLPCEQFAVIGFGGQGSTGSQSRVVYHPWRLWGSGWSKATADSREQACETIAEWRVAGGTPTYDALLAARRLEGVDTVILWTDGLPSIPEDDDAQGRVLRLAEEMASEGITINCIGVGNLSGRGGGELDLEGAEFLRRLAHTTGGEYFAL